MSNIVTTVQRHIMETQRRYPRASGEFSELLTQVILAAKLVHRQVNKAGLTNILGGTGQFNIHGEQVMKLDHYSNQILISSLEYGGHLCIMASEENPEPIAIPEEYPAGKYVVIFDPLDGSSNIDVNVSVGTIFSIHRKISKGKRGTLPDLLQPGYRQAGAGYFIYGSSTMLVYSTGLGVHGFTLDPGIGEFLLSHENIRIPRFGATYSCNEGNINHWNSGYQSYISFIKKSDTPSGRPYQARYTGSLVADIHRTFLKGGIFFYPGTVHTEGEDDFPHGKLRLLYECSPIAYLVEQAGGQATDGYRRILDIVPEKLHQRTPFIAGSHDNVSELHRFLEAEQTSA